MNTLIFQSKVDEDGVLRLSLAIGSTEAGRDVQVTVMPVPRPATQGEWADFIHTTAGSVTDSSFQRHEQGDCEQREALW